MFVQLGFVTLGPGSGTIRSNESDEELDSLSTLLYFFLGDGDILSGVGCFIVDSSMDLTIWSKSDEESSLEINSLLLKSFLCGIVLCLCTDTSAACDVTTLI